MFNREKGRLHLYCEVTQARPFAREPIIKKSWETSHLTPAEKYILKAREMNPVTSETMFLQNIRGTAVRRHKQRLKSTLKK